MLCIYKLRPYSRDMPVLYASPLQAIWELSLAGQQLSLQAVGRWLASMVDRDLWPGAGGADKSDQAVSQACAASQDVHLDVDAALTSTAYAATGAPLQYTGVPVVTIAGTAAASDNDDGAGLNVAAVSEAAAVHAEPDGSVEASEKLPTGGKNRLGWHPRWGDRAQSLVFIGQGLRGAAAARLHADLAWCMVDDAEVALGEDAWAAWDDSGWLGLLEPLDA